MKAKFIKRITDREPKDETLSRNGGDYYFGRDIYQLEDGRTFGLYWTSSEFDFCNLTGWFEDTEPVHVTVDEEEVEVDGKPLIANVAKYKVTGEIYAEIDTIPCRIL